MLKPEPAYEHNGRHVSRAEFYAIACDPRRPVAVEACAGAGKTWMLVSRIVRALLDEGDEAACAPHEILAITFTRKAAGEMRERLDEWLEHFARCTPGQLVHELMIRGLDPAAAEAAAPRLQALYGRLLAGGRPVQFRTFHAWFASLLRSAPLAVLEHLGLPANYQLLEDDAEAVARCWRPFQAVVAAHPEARADYQDLVATYGRSQTARALREALNRRVEFALADAHGRVQDAVQRFDALYPQAAGLSAPVDLLCGDVARARWLGWARALALEVNKTPQNAAAAVIELFEAGALASAAQAFPRLRRAFFVADEDRLNRNLEPYAAAREAERELQLICAAQAQHEAWLHQRRMTRLTRLLNACYADVKRAHGWVDMNDVEGAAHLLLRNAELWGWVLQRLDAGVRHLLVDEFQDTNPLQWQALYSWLGSYAGAGARQPSVFIVGDPKQSIYRFRRAEPQVFIAAKAFMRDGLGGDLLNCDHTHRNAQAVVGVVNRVMQQAQSAGEFDGFRDHTTESRLAGRVRRLPQLLRDDSVAAPQAIDRLAWRDSLTVPRLLPEEQLLQKECAQAARWIAQRIAGGEIAAKDVMVLARQRSRLALMQDELRKLHVAVQQPEKNDLHDAPEVQDMVALLDALVSPGHDLSLARALRSPLWSLDDDMLVQLALRQRATPGSAWFDLLQSGADLPAPLAGIGAQLRRWQKALAALPPHDALAAIYHEADVLARFAACAPAALRASVLANLRALLAASLELDGARFATPYALVRALRAGRVRAPSLAAADAVQLLTVHGAKGLEAGLVLMLDCDAPTQRAQTMGVLVDWPGEAPAPRRFVFIASEKQPPACAADALVNEQAARQREEINGLYVAATRARGELVLSAVEAARANGQSWWSRLAPHAQAIELSAALGRLPSAPAFAEFHMKKMPVAPVVVAQTAIKTIAKAVDEGASAFGQAMHRLLEWAMPGVPMPDGQVRAVAREFALAFDDARGAAALAERIRAGQGAWAWQADAIDWQGNEVALSHGGQLLRIDRLVRHRESGTWWVLDYKSAARPQHDVALIAQMQRYRQAVQAANPDAAVRAAFLTGQGELVEVRE